MIVKFLLGLLLLSYLGYGAVVTRGPFLQSASPSGMVICWRTDGATTSEVGYSLNPGGPFTYVSVAGMRVNHEVPLSGLLPDTRYYYQVKGVPATGPAVIVGNVNHWFRTAPANSVAAPTRLWVVGDSGYQFAGATNVYNAYLNKTAAEGKETALMLMLGDNAYDIGTDSQMQAAIFNRYAGLFKNTPVWAAFGNHDGYTVPNPWTEVTPHDLAFRFPTTGECGGVASGSERYFSFNHGNIHFICLDTFTPVNAMDAPGGAYGMVDWLADDLKACDSKWIIAFMHYGPYSRGSHFSDDPYDGLMQTRNYVIPLLEAYGTDLVLYGHSHVYERSGLIDGYYGISSTWNPATMVKWQGNGSDLGGVTATGEFSTTSEAAQGGYQKSAAQARSGTVYAVVGSSSAPQGWYGGSTSLVNPTPHPAHLVSLNLLGSMVIDVEGPKLRGQFLDGAGAVRDDFTIVKGSEYRVHGAMPKFGAGGSPGLRFPVTRTGAVMLADEVSMTTTELSGGGVLPESVMVSFAAGQTEGSVDLTPVSGGAGPRFQVALNPISRVVGVDGTARVKYEIVGGAQLGEFATTPAHSWYASRFGGVPSNAAVWDGDDDGDGLPLKLEYALGGEPGRNDHALLPRMEKEGGSVLYRYLRAFGRSDLSYRVKGSGDLLSWPLPDPTEVADGVATVFGEPRKVVSSSADSRKFLRLEVEFAP